MPAPPEIVKSSLPSFFPKQEIGVASSETTVSAQPGVAAEIEKAAVDGVPGWMRIGTEANRIAEARYGKLIDMAGCDIPTAARAILSLMPLDSFVPAPVARMQVVGNPDGVVPIFARMQAVVDEAEGRVVEIQPLERFAFYAAAKQAFAIIRTADSGPYGCCIMKKGVVDLPAL